MNFLAHLYLCDASPPAFIGSLLPDLARGWSRPNLSSEVLAAVRLHQAVDAFTDTHPVAARSKARIRRQGRYAGILIDIFYDHFLACDWRRYSSVPLSDFIAQVHQAFQTHRHLLPAVMRYPVDKMTEQNWLASYAHIAGIRTVLERMSHRLSERFARPVNLAPAVDDLVAQREPLAADFHEFFPELIVYCHKEGVAQ